MPPPYQDGSGIGVITSGSAPLPVPDGHCRKCSGIDGEGAIGSVFDIEQGLAVMQLRVA